MGLHEMLSVVLFCTKVQEVGNGCSADRPLPLLSLPYRQTDNPFVMFLADTGLPTPHPSSDYRSGSSIVDNQGRGHVETVFIYPPTSSRTIVQPFLSIKQIPPLYLSIFIHLTIPFLLDTIRIPTYVRGEKKKHRQARCISQRSPRWPFNLVLPPLRSLEETFPTKTKSWGEYPSLFSFHSFPLLKTHPHDPQKRLQ